jgi:ribonuclease P protein component
MNRRFRLARSADFVRVRRSGKSFAHPLAVLVTYPSGLPSSRFAFSAGKALGSAVHRNRAKRLLREAVRCLLPDVAPGWDVILIARPPLAGADHRAVTQAVAGLLRRAKLMEVDDRPTRDH